MCCHNLQALQYGRGLSYVTLIWSLIKCKLMTRLEKELYLLKNEHQTQRLLLYYIAINMLNLYYWLITMSIQMIFIWLHSKQMWQYFDISSVLLFNRTFQSARAIIIFFFCQTQFTTSLATFTSGCIWFYTPF